MSIRSKLNNNPAAATVGAVVLLVVCIGLIFLQLSGMGEGGSAFNKSYYLDAKTKEVFVGPRSHFPVEAPSGPTEAGGKAGFKARIFACGECGEYGGMSLEQLKTAHAAVGWIQRIPPGAGEGGTPPRQVPRQVSDPETINWIGPGGAEVRKVKQVDLPCEDPEACYPF